MVRYSCSQAAAQARHLLDNRQVNGTKIQVIISNNNMCERHLQTFKSPCQNCQMKSKYFLFLLWIFQIGLYVKSLKIEFV